VLGALDKEVNLIAVPLLIWYRPRGALLGALLAIALTLWLRWPFAGQAVPIGHPSLRGVLSGIVRAGGPFVPWVIAGWPHSTIETRRILGVLSVGVAVLTLGASDTGRMLGLLAPFWIPVAVTRSQH
jgi:hypothetical protein